jgi:hypothetical protein
VNVSVILERVFYVDADYNADVDDADDNNNDDADDVDGDDVGHCSSLSVNCSLATGYERNWERNEGFIEPTRTIHPL